MTTLRRRRGANEHFEDPRMVRLQDRITALEKRLDPEVEVPGQTGDVITNVENNFYGVDYIQRGPFASRPVASDTAPKVYYCDDSPLVFVRDGSIWYPHGLTQAFGLGKVAADFTIVQNGSGASLVDDKGTLLFSRDYGGVVNQENWSVAVREAGGAPGPAGGPGTPTPYTCTVGFELIGGGAASATPAYSGLSGNPNAVAGVCRHHDTRWSALMLIGAVGGWTLFKGTGATTGSGPSTNFTIAAPMLRDRVVWLRVTDSGANPTPSPGGGNVTGQDACTFWFSVDGVKFTKCWTENRVHGFGNLPGDDNLHTFNAGMIINPFNTDVQMRVFDFSLTHP